MRNIDDRLRRDLEQIADRTTPSPTTAWAAIQSRIEDQADEPETEITMLQPDTPNDRRVDARLLVAAAAVLVVLVGISVALFRTGDSNSLDVTDTDTTVPVTSTVAPTTTDAQSPSAAVSGADDAAAVALAEAFIAARNAYDGAAVRALVADDATIATVYEWIDSPDQYGLLTDYERAHGMRFLDPRCDGSSLGRVRCTYTLESDVTVALGVGPYDASFTLEIGDGVIQQVNHTRTGDTGSAGTYVTDVLNVGFGRWVAINHAEESLLMYNPEGGNNVDPPLITPESVALWEQLLPEFIADVLVPVAVVDAALAGEVVAHAGPDATTEQVRSILPNSMDLGAVGPLDGQEWVQVLTADGRDLNGWVNAASLIAIEGEVDQPRPLFEMASSVRNALLQSTPANRLADRTDELRVSIDGPLDADDPVYQAQDLSTSADVAAAIEGFGATNALLETDRISINTPIRATDAQSSVAALFPEATVVELHYSGDAGDEAATWESVLLVFVPNLSVGTTATDVVEDSTAFKIAGIAFVSASQ